MSWKYQIAGAFGLLALISPSGGALAGEMLQVRLQTHLAPPYQVRKENRLGGSSVDVLDCIAKRMGHSFQYALAPQLRNRELVRQGRVDGFFTSVPDASMDEYAVPSDPLILERWKIFRLAENSQTNKIARGEVGAVLGSNEYVWLKEKGLLDKSLNIRNMSSLVMMISRQRLPFVLADEATFFSALKKNKMDHQKFQSRFVLYAPLVVYFSKRFLKRNPRFLTGFNQANSECSENRRVPNAQEKKRLAKFAWMDVQLEEAIKRTQKAYPQQNQDEMEKVREDRAWLNAGLEGKRTPLMDSLLKNELSQWLRDVADRSNGRIAEIFIFDDKGYIVAMNRATSDYWQGDEMAYEALFKAGRSVNFSPILFDHSTRKFQIQMALPLHHSETGKLIAGLVIGFDAHEALSKQSTLFGGF